MNKDWKNYYNEFKNSGNIDFLGINIGEDGIHVKCYKNPVQPQEAQNPYITQFIQTDCCSFVTPIHREDGYEEDIRLKNKTDDNMQSLFSLLKGLRAEFSDYEEEVRRLSAMPVCSLPKHKYASMFYMCIVQNDEKPTKYKFHYITRMCRDPDCISKNMVYMDSMYLGYIEALKSKELNVCTGIVRNFLSIADSNLWTVGSDYDFEKGVNKYKVYIKCNNTSASDIIASLLQSLTEEFAQVVKDKLYEVEEFIISQIHTYIYGFGVCCDSKMRPSLNIYIIV